ncbi:Phage tail-collar fibre protein [Thiohalospira halophila DSM 15071]|uniref:Phage tail-collar fibre protein n=1 Tax=Thiohalospira halophila DSM 15071 TaxID=1123397 RepID=A0A1I1UBJ2_9GAMM|nr:phage tail protein [Thiohalospira halophila]SFD68202.1 Phage tail-collar fibre protein [Thiohalospira halophila DSM 15071]
MATFYTILTDVGQNKIANAIAVGETIEITDLAVGDGDGSLPTPDSSFESLVNEVRRASINSSQTDPDNPSWIVVEQVLPPDVGGWTIREVGIFDVDGDLIAYGNYPETYKPVLDEGSSRTQTVRFITEVSDTSAVTLKVDASVVLATRELVQREARADYITDATLASGVSTGDAVYWDHDAGEYKRAIADGSAASHPVGLADAVNGRVYSGGLAEGLLTGLTAGATYYLSGSDAGALITDRPAYPVEVGVAHGAESLRIGIHADTLRRESTGDPNGNLAADRLYEAAWDTSTATPVLYLSTEADGTVDGTTWTPAADLWAALSASGAGSALATFSDAKRFTRDADGQIYLEDY